MTHARTPRNFLPVGALLTILVAFFVNLPSHIAAETSNPHEYAQRADAYVEKALKEGAGKEDTMFAEARPPAISPERHAEVRRMRDEDGREIAELAQLFKVSSNTIRRA